MKLVSVRDVSLFNSKPLSVSETMFLGTGGSSMALLSVRLVLQEHLVLWNQFAGMHFSGHRRPSSRAS